MDCEDVRNIWSWYCQLIQLLIISETRITKESVEAMKEFQRSLKEFFEMGLNVLKSQEMLCR